MNDRLLDEEREEYERIFEFSDSDDEIIMRLPPKSDPIDIPASKIGYNTHEVSGNKYLPNRRIKRTSVVQDLKKFAEEAGIDLSTSEK